MRRKPQTKGVYAFIDSQNLNVGVQKFGWKMDWKKFRIFLAEKYGVTKAYMFIGYVPEFESLYQQLHEAGYLIVLKPTFDMTRVRQVDTKQLTSDSKTSDQKDSPPKKEDDRPTKGNVDADLVLWAMKEIPHYSKAVIVSGDGDFYALIEYLDEQKKLLRLLAPNAHYSGLFNRYESYVERLDKYKHDLAYFDHKKRMKNNPLMNEIKLNTGDNIPLVGFGTWQLLPGRFTKNAVTAALDAGYRLIDTARIYGNEGSVGKAVNSSEIPREDLFITTKLWNASQGYDKAHRAFNNSLKRLDLSYIDLYLIHWPVTGKRDESWQALTEIQATGKAKNIGVSNYTTKHLKELMSESSVIPSINQIEFHPFLYEEQKQLLEFCNSHNIVVEAYSPLAHGKKTDDKYLPVLAKKYGKSSAQVILRWCVQHGTVPLPKSSNPQHIRDNLDIFDFELTDKEMEQINSLSDGTRTCWNPTNKE